MKRAEPITEPPAPRVARNVVFGGATSRRGPAAQVHLDWGHGPQRVIGPYGGRRVAPALPPESSCLGVQLKVRGKLHVRLNMTPRPIANKYREGKLKRTLKREFKST